MDIKGRDLVTAMPRRSRSHPPRSAKPSSSPFRWHRRGAEGGARAHAPELAGDIADRGIVLSGGGALLKNMDALLREETGLPVFLAADPLSAVVIGAGKALETLDVLRSVAR